MTAYGGIAILIHRDTMIGSNVTIGTKVTIGGAPSGVPKIQDDVFLATGSCILGGITIAQGAISGANTTIVRDCEPFCIYAGSPGRIIARVNSKNTSKYASMYKLRSMDSIQNFVQRNESWLFNNN